MVELLEPECEQLAVDGGGGQAPAAPLQGTRLEVGENSETLQSEERHADKEQVECAQEGDEPPRLPEEQSPKESGGKGNVTGGNSKSRSNAELFCDFLKGRRGPIKGRLHIPNTRYEFIRFLHRVFVLQLLNTIFF